MSDATQELLEQVLALRRELAEVREKLAYREQIFVGWKDIAAYLGYSEDHAKALGQDPVDPIPYRYNGGFVEAQRSMLDAWLFRRRVPAQRKPIKVGGEQATGEGSRKQLGLFETPKRGRARDGSAS